jgi:hemolysin D
VTDLVVRPEAPPPALLPAPVPSGNLRRQEIEFLPAALEVLEAPPSPTARWFLLGIVAFALATLAWSIVATVDVIASSQGRIFPTGKVKVVQPAETGVVRAIHVRDGEAVVAGQHLIALEFTGADAARTQIMADLTAAKLDRARLTALDGDAERPESAFVLPDGVPAEVATAQRRLMASRAAERRAQIAALEAELARQNASLQSIDAQVSKLQAAIPLLARRVEARRILTEKEIGSVLTFLEIRQQLVELEHELLVQRSRRQEALASLRAAESQRARAEAEFGRAIQTELADAEKRVWQLTQELAKAEQRVALQALAAPVDGVIQQLAVNTLGGVVTPAQPLLVVVPKDSRLEVEAMVLNRDIGFVGPGQRAVVKIETFNFTKYGSLEGTVLAVSQDAIEDKAQGLVYPAKIGIDRQAMLIDGRTVPLSPGMAVTVEIKTEERRLIEYFLAPLIRYREEALRER